MHTILFQLWFFLTILSAIAAALTAIIIIQQKLDTSYEEVRDFKKAVAFAFFGVDAEIIARFISLLVHTTYYPTTEMVICCFGRLLEAIGLWGLVLHLTNIWPFNKKD